MKNGFISKKFIFFTCNKEKKNVFFWQMTFWSFCISHQNHFSCQMDPQKSHFWREKEKQHLYNHTYASRPKPNTPSLYFHFNKPLFLISFSLPTTTTSPSLNSFILHLFSLFIRKDGLQRHTTYAAANTSRGVAWCARCCRVTNHVF
jgi:hypothetical protein